MECKLLSCACKHILPHPRVFCVKTALKGGEFRGKCGEMQGMPSRRLAFTPEITPSVASSGLTTPPSCLWQDTSPYTGGGYNEVTLARHLLVRWKINGIYSLRHAAEDKPRTARHLPEEEAKLRNLANQENACSPLNPTPKKYCVFFWDPEGS